MSVPMHPIEGTGRFQWNGGAWCGTALGGTAWLLPMTLFLLANDQTGLAVVPAVCFVLTLAVATALWMRRDRLLPFRAYMILLGVLSIVTPLVWMAVSIGGSPDSLAHMNWPESPIAGLGALLIAPALIGLFVYLESSHPRPAGNSGSKPHGA